MEQREATSKQTVLVVDDDPGVCRLVSEILARQGYQVLVAHDGAEALAIANSVREPIDLALTDMMMPVLTGNELAERLLRDRPQIRVLFMSGYVASAVSDSRVPATFLAKPFTPRSLIQRVRDVLNGPPYGSIALKG